MKPGPKPTGQTPNAQLADSLAQVRAVLAKHFGFLFIVASLFAILYAVFQVQQYLQASLPTDESGVSKEYSTAFDKATIYKINSLGSSSQEPLPTGRINPFSE